MLKIRQPRNAYDLLGLPWTAGPVQVRTRYRQLIRARHKDMPTTELLQDEKCRQWTDSYLLLTGPERREYDRRLRQSRGTEPPPDRLGGLSAPQLMLVEAEVAFARRRLNEAAELAREALKTEGKNAQGYALLGDILREQGKYKDALTMYNYAIQFAPNNRRYWQLLQEVTALREGRALPRRFTRETPGPLNRPISAWAGVALAVALVALGISYLHGRWGQPAFLTLPLNLIYAALAAGFVMGLALAATAIIGPFDDEMLWYQVTGMGSETVPLGLFIAIPGIVFFWASLVFYAIVSYLDEHLSLSVLITLVVCGLMAISFGLLGPRESRTATYAIGGNFVFFGFLWGWVLGSVRKRVFEH